MKLTSREMLRLVVERYSGSWLRSVVVTGRNRKVCR